MPTTMVPEETSAEVDGKAAGEEPEATRVGGPWPMRLAALGFVVAVILGECLVAYLLISRWSPATAAAAGTQDKSTPEAKADARTDHGKGDGANKGGSGSAQNGHDADPTTPDLVEVDLEKFSVTAHQPTSNTTVRIEFHLFGMVSTQEKEEFERLLKGNQHRFREQVLMTIRSAEGTDLADAGLGLIKRQILEKTNSLLGKPLLRAIVVSDFSYLEQ